MARPLRLNYAGAWYHVTSRGNERKAIYRDDRDRMHFVELFSAWRERFRVRLRAYVLMENHYHLLLETPEANLSKAMQWLNTSYTVWFNRRHQRAGHLFQGRFKAVIVEAQTWALGDWGRELALHLGRELAGMSLGELCQGVEARKVMTVSVAISRFRSRMIRQKSLGKLVSRAKRELENAGFYV
jgi:REP element-mobilizing transposase RayT